jgi:hypothetical protein
MTVRAAIIAAVFVAGPASAGPVTCSTWQQITTCSSPDGYVSHETTWNGITTGSDNRGDRWSTSRWRDVETTVTTPER